jgi:hypothetical protein
MLISQKFGMPYVAFSYNQMTRQIIYFKKEQSRYTIQLDPGKVYMKLSLEQLHTTHAKLQDLLKYEIASCIATIRLFFVRRLQLS